MVRDVFRQPYSNFQTSRKVGLQRCRIMGVRDCVGYKLGDAGANFCAQSCVQGFVAPYWDDEGAIRHIGFDDGVE